GAGAERAAARLQVRRPLPGGRRALPRRGAGAGAARRVVGALSLSAVAAGERGRAMTAPAEPAPGVTAEPAPGAPAEPAPGAPGAAGDALVSLRGVSKHFPIKVAWPKRPAPAPLRLWRAISRMPATVQAVTQVDLEIRRGETLGLVGESG